MKDTIGVVGVGNTILQDEGAAVHLIKRFKDHWCPCSNVDFIGAETAGIGVADIITEYDAVILLDTILTKEEPGSIIVKEKDELVKKNGSSVTAGHALGLRQAIEFAALTDSIPEKLILIGIVPAVIHFGETLSRQVEEAMASYEIAVIRQLAIWGVELNRIQQEKV